MADSQVTKSTGGNKLPILTKSSFTRWKFEMLIILASKDLSDVTLGNDKAPEPPQLPALPQVNDILNQDEVNAYNMVAAQRQVLADDFSKAKKNWTRKDAEAMTLLSRSLDDHHHLMIRGCGHSRHIWAQLLMLYEQKTATSVFLAQRELHECKWKSSSTALSFIAELRQIAARLDSLGEPVTEGMVISKIMNELPTPYQHLRDQWEIGTLGGMRLNLDDLQSQLIRVESLHEARKKSSHQQHGEALLSSQPQQRWRKPNPQRSQQQTNVKCHYCGIRGHMQNVCRKRIAAEGAKCSSAQDNRQANQSQPRAGSSGQQKRSPPAKKTNDNTGLICSADFDLVTHDEFTHMLRAAQEAGITGQWIADSGATQHMTSRREWFSDYVESKEQQFVTVGNGESVPIAGTGRINIQFDDGVNIINTFIAPVLHVPELGNHNLFSIPAVTKKGYTVTMTADDVRLRGALGTVTGRKDGKLYMLNIVTLSSDEATSGSIALTARLLDIKNWHERLAHVSPDKIRQMIKHGAVKGLPDRLDDPEKFFCEPCVLGKMHRKHFTEAEKRDCKAGEYIHSDLCGPFETPSLGGNRYYAIFKDEHSAYRLIVFLETKDQLLEKLKQVVTQIRSETGNNVIRLRTDNGREYLNKDVTAFLQEKGIFHEVTAPYNPEQNGMSERENRTLLNLARSMIYSSNLPNILWAEAISTAAYTMNRVTNREETSVTPHEMWFGKKPDISHMRVFGCRSYGKTPDSLRTKLAPQAEKYIFVGYTNTDKNYRLWEEGTTQVYLFRDVVFDESTFPTAEEQQEMNPAFVPLPEKRGRGRPKGSKNKPKAAADATEVVTTTPSAAARSPAAESESALLISPDPLTVREALQREDSHLWQAAVEKEIASLEKKETWDKVVLPPGKHAIDSRFIFKIKRNMDGSVSKYKARLVARGFRQRPGIDFTDTFAPVIRYESIRTILSIAARNDWDIVQLDVETAFLNGELFEEITMKQPEGLSDGTDKVLRLKKGLYGLKQAPLAWNNKLKSVLLQLGLQQSKQDSCVFFSNKEGKAIIIGVYVDDMIVCSQSSAKINEIVKGLGSAFEITTCKLEKFVGLEVQRFRERNMLFIACESYNDQMLDKYNMKDCRPVVTPGDYNDKLSSLTPPSDEERALMKGVPFKEAIGSLLYAAVTCRPDISFIVTKLAQHGLDPSPAAWATVKRVFRYLKGTKDQGLALGMVDQPLTAYCDADYAGDSDTARSTSGTIVTLYGGPVIWSSRLQRCVALSTTESEYLSIGDGVKDVLWLRGLLFEFGFPREEPTTVYNDNTSAIKLVKNPEFHQRTKHINVKYHFIREKQEDKQIKVKYLETGKQPADMLTKNLTQDKLDRCKRSVNMLSLAMMAMVCCMLIPSATAQFHSAPQVIWREAKEPVVRGSISFTYSLKMEPGCERFQTPQMRTWCKDLFTRHVYPELEHYCSTPVRVRRFEPVTAALAGVVIVGSLAFGGLGLSIYNTVKINRVEDELHARIDAVHDILKTMNADIADMNEKMQRFINHTLEKETDYLDSLEYPAVVMNVKTSLDAIFTAWNDKPPKVHPRLFRFMNITLPCDDCPVSQMTPLTCKWKPDDGTLHLDFYGYLTSKTEVLLRAAPFTFFKFSGDQVCKTEFQGPFLISFNKMENATCRLKHVSKKGIYLEKTATSCGTVSSVWKETKCMDKRDITSDDVIQVEPLGHTLQVYCNGFNITMYGKNLTCPPYVFVLPTNASFLLDGHSYTSKLHKSEFLTPEYVVNWQNRINAHVAPDTDPYMTHIHTKEIDDKIDKERSLNLSHPVIATSAALAIIFGIALVGLALYLFRNRKHEFVVPKSVQESAAGHSRTQERESVGVNVSSCLPVLAAAAPAPGGRLLSEFDQDLTRDSKTHASAKFLVTPYKGTSVIPPQHDRRE